MLIEYLLCAGVREGFKIVHTLCGPGTGQLGDPKAGLLLCSYWLMGGSRGGLREVQVAWGTFEGLEQRLVTPRLCCPGEKP